MSPRGLPTASPHVFQIDRAVQGLSESEKTRNDPKLKEPFFAILAISRSRYSPSGPCCC
jgi:hypothetical protein